MNEELFEPLQFYKTIGKARHEENVRQYLEDLITRSGVDAEANRLTVKKYHEEEEAAQRVAKHMKRYRVLRVLLILTAIVGGLLLLPSLLAFSEALWLRGTLELGFGMLLLLGSLLLILKVLNPKIKDTDALHDKHRQKAKEYLWEAYGQMRPLNDLFDDTDTADLIQKTIPRLKLDQRFECGREAMLREKYDFYDLLGEKDSMVDILSGSLSGNPFVFLQSRVFQMQEQTYHGSLTITWTESYTDSDGKRRTRVRSEVLHASITRPKPTYHKQTVLCYGHQAAPELSFSRSPQHSERLSEKELEKKVRKGEKALHKRAEDMLEKGEAFEALANTEFEVLFGALDRDHEVQFRLLYTPLAQQNTVALLTDAEGFGDDFSFRKEKRLNILASEHGRDWCMDTGTDHYRSYDLELIKRNFIDFNNAYFRSIFFDLAPLMAIPAYGVSPESYYVEREDPDRCFGDYEHEVMANRLGGELIPTGCATEVIYKTRHLSGQGGEDRVSVLAWGYTATERIEYVSVWGGDGRMHPVPVHWTEYDYVEKESEILVRAAEYSEREHRRRCEEKGEGEDTFFHRMTAHILH